MLFDLKSGEIKSQLIRQNCVVGGNSKIYKVKIDSKTYSLKDYSGCKSPVKSLENEFSATKMMNSLIPELFVQAFECDLDQKFALYEWANGSKESINSVRFDVVLAGLRKIHKTFQDNSKSTFGKATDFVFCLSDIRTQIESRLSELSKIRIENLDEFKIVLEEIGNIFYGLNDTSDFLTDSFTISLSDFGFHNIIWQNDNNCKFIDLEYFGVDSIAKFTGDSLIHPLNIWETPFKRKFLDFYVNKNSNLEWELKKLMPYLAIKWVTIILKRFSTKAPTPQDISSKFNYIEKLKLIALSSSPLNDVF